MAQVVRAALVQTAWTGDKESMIGATRTRRERRPRGRPGDVLPRAVLRAVLLPGAGREVLRLRRVGAAARRSSGSRRWRAELGMVIVLPVYEQEQPGVLYNTAAVIDADGTYLGKYRKTHIPQVKGFWEKFYFRPGNLGYPVFDTAVGPGRRLHLLRPALPRGLAGAGPQRRRDRVQPVGDQPRPVQVPLEAGAAGRRRGQRVLHRRDQPGRRRGRSATTTSTARSTSSTREGKFVGEVGDATRRRAGRPRPRPGPARRGPRPLAVLPRPPARRVRRPLT